MTVQATKKARDATEAASESRCRQSRAVFRPAVDIVETEDAVTVLADVPGVDEQTADVSLEKHLLTIKGTVEPVEVEGETLTYSEYGIGDFERTFTLSDEIAREGVEAIVRDGVLRVRLPKTKQATTQKIPVGTE